MDGKKGIIIILLGIFLIILIVGLLIGYFIFSIVDVANNLDPADCEKISGPLERSRKVDCYMDIGIKLADQSICEKITNEQPYVKGKNYCKAIASRDINQCEPLTDYWKDRCKAVLLKDSSYCDVKEGKPSQGCLNAMEFYEPFID